MNTSRKAGWARGIASAIPGTTLAFGLAVGQLAGPLWAIGGVILGAVVGTLFDRYDAVRRR